MDGEEQLTGSEEEFSEDEAMSDHSSANGSSQAESPEARFQQQLAEKDAIIKQLMEQLAHMQKTMDDIREKADRDMAEMKATMKIINENTAKRGRDSPTAATPPAKLTRMQQQQPGQAGPATSNRFESLSIEPCKENETEESQPPPSGKKTLQRLTRTRELMPDEPKQKKTEPTMTEPAKKTTNPLTTPGSQVRGKPDFVATGVSIPLMEKEMASRGVECRARIAANGFQHFWVAPEQRTILADWLQEQDCAARMSTPADQQKGVILAKGIHHGYTPEDVITWYKEEAAVQLTRAERFQEKSKDGARPFDWWILTTSTTEEIEFIRKVRSFGRMRLSVRYEKYFGGEPTRCFKCQLCNSHTAKNCLGKNSYCSKCPGQHDSRECPQFPTDPPKDASNEDLKKYFCVNCKVFGHWAGWSRCPVWHKACQEKRARKEAEIQQHKARTTKLIQRIPNASDFTPLLPARFQPAPLPTNNAWTSSSSSKQSAVQALLDSFDETARNFRSTLLQLIAN